MNEVRVEDLYTLTNCCIKYKHCEWYPCDSQGNILANEIKHDYIVNWINDECYIDFGKSYKLIKFDFYIHDILVESYIIDVMNVCEITLTSYEDLPFYQNIELAHHLVNKKTKNYIIYNFNKGKIDNTLYRFMTRKEYIDMIDNHIISERSKNFIKNNNIDLLLYAKNLYIEKTSLIIQNYKITVEKI